MKKLLLIICLFAAAAIGANKHFTGADSATNLYWGNAANWSPAGIPAGTLDTAIFGDSTSSQVVMEGNKYIVKMVLKNGYVFSSGATLGIYLLGGTYTPLVTNGAELDVPINFSSGYGGEVGQATFGPIKNKKATSFVLGQGSEKYKFTIGKLITDAKIEYGPMYGCWDSTYFTDSVSCSTLKYGGYTQLRSHWYDFGAAVVTTSGDVDAEAYDQTTLKQFYQTSSWFIGGSYLLGPLSTLDAGTSAITLQGAAACLFKDYGKVHYNVTVNKTTSAASWAFIDTGDSSRFNDLNLTNGKCWFKYSKYIRDLTNANDDTVSREGNWHISRNYTGSSANKWKNTSGALVFTAVGSHTVTPAGVRLDSVQALGPVVLVGSDTITSFIMAPGVKLSGQAGQTIALLSYDIEGTAGALDSVVSSTPGSRVTLSLPAFDTVGYVAFKDITGTSYIYLDSTAHSLGNNQKIVSLGTYGTATLTPARGIISGGTEISVAVPGGFVAGGATLGGEPVSSWTVTSYKTATFTAPAHAVGSADLKLWNSDADTITVADAFEYYQEGPTITGQPAGVRRIVGQTATFSVTATGAGTLGYQWKRNGSNVGTSLASYTTPAITRADTNAGYVCLVTDANGTSVSDTAHLSVRVIPVIDSIRPIWQRRGRTFTIRGLSFLPDRGTGSIVLNSTNLGTPGSWSDTAIMDTIPADFSPRGTYNCIIKNNDTLSDTVPLRVLIPSITGVNPE